jgi:hypothetical protein
MDATQGFAMALVRVSVDTILRFTALGTRTGELLPVVQLAISAGLPYTDIAGLIVTHPTMNEGLVSLFGSIPARSRLESLRVCSFIEALLSSEREIAH